jgi:hypothetical protein
MQENNSTQNSTASGDDNMPDIPSLIQQVQQLSNSYGSWSKASQWLIGITAVVTLLYFGASYKALIKAGELKDVQDKLSKAKDDQLTTNLKEKDLEISNAKRDASAAGERASIADERASKADERAGLANERASKANERAGQLENEAAQARVRQQELKQQNLATEARLGEEQDKRLALEKTLSRRSLIILGLGQGKRNTDPLKPFAGTKVIIEYLPDFEAYRAALTLAGLLEDEHVGWKVVSLMGSAELVEPFFDGVVVEIYRPDLQALTDPNRQAEAEAGIKAQQESREKAEALVKFLTSSNWEARSSNSYPPNVFPPDTLRVRVGFKPEPHLPGVDEQEWLRRREEETKKREEEINAIRKKQGKEPIRLPRP